MSSRRFPSLAVGLLLAGAISACNCGAKQHVTTVPEPYTVVPGSPSVDPNGPQVDIDQQPPPVTYGINVPRQCDLFVQNTVRKVDILWVIQSSPSMAPHQASLAANFQSFVNFLLSADPPIDFHIGVVSTDTDNPNEQGKLHGWSQLGSSATGSFIGCDANHSCNTDPGAALEPDGGVDPAVGQSVEQAFTQMSNVGTEGSATQRGLYASYLALNRPENLDNGSGQGFVRPDAALYVVYVGDEDDLSCGPYVGVPPPSGSCDTFDAECRCADDAALDWGSTAFFERFLENYKGYGHSDLVAAAAVVATSKDQIINREFAGVPTEGCSAVDPNAGPVEAAYGGRYLAVAQATGGSATSICSGDFSDALNRLGFAVSGLRRDFKLSRGPDTNTIQVYVSAKNSPTCQHDSDCTDPSFNSCQAGRCAESITESLQPGDDSAQYIRCDNGVLRNVVEFGATVVPPAQGTIEVCYDVDAHFSQVCQ